ncbi:MAG: sugar phosphate nucleotidyltransferase [Phycisphaerae bacterium]
MRHAVIMAGGAGTRLWPLSRRHRPKQLLKIIGGISLLRSSYERLLESFPPERIYVITGEKYLPLVANELPEVPSQNLFGEPQARHRQRGRIGVGDHQSARSRCGHRGIHRRPPDRTGRAFHQVRRIGV